MFPSSRPPRRLARSRLLRAGAVALLILTGLGTAFSSPSQTEALALGKGNYAMTASVFGTDTDALVGEETSNGRRIRPFDRMVALPACTESSCPWLPLNSDPDSQYGAQTRCAESDGLCWVQIVSVTTGSCAVAPVIDRGPLFTRDNWWDLRKDRTYYYKRGLPAAEAARDGADLGFGAGISDAGYDIAGEYDYAAAIDIGAGTWVDLGLDPDIGISEVKVKLLWQAGVSHRNACGGDFGNGETTDEVNLRGGPSTDDDILDVLPAGRRVSISGPTQNGFYQVDVDGERGWIFAEYLRPDGGGSGSRVGFVTDEVNFRAGPSTADDVYQEVPEGSIAVVTGSKQNGFYPVAFNGKAGWISQDWLDLGGSSAPNPNPGSGTEHESAVTTDFVNFRASASLSSSIHSVINPGRTVELEGSEKDGFYKVIYNKKSGWIAGDYLMVVDGESGGGSADPQTLVVTDSLNLRAGPSTSDDVLVVMLPGVLVETTGEKKNGFLSVIYRGTEGWAYADYLE